MQHLLADRDEEGNAFTWLNRWRLWSLQFALTWQPHGGGGSSLSLGDTMRMTLAQAWAWYRWIGETREREAENIQHAHEEARRKR
jgi:hypothetical protein